MSIFVVDDQFAFWKYAQMHARPLRRPFDMNVGLEDLMGFRGDRIDLSTVRFTPELLRSVPRHLAFKYQVLPISESPDRLEIALAAPPDLDSIDSLSYLLQRHLVFRAANEGQLATFIRRLYGAPGESNR